LNLLTNPTTLVLAVASTTVKRGAPMPTKVRCGVLCGIITPKLSGSLLLLLWTSSEMQCSLLSLKQTPRVAAAALMQMLVTLDQRLLVLVLVVAFGAGVLLNQPHRQRRPLKQLRKQGKLVVLNKLLLLIVLEFHSILLLLVSGLKPRLS
jgi:hypothetical protein